MQFQIFIENIKISLEAIRSHIPVSYTHLDLAKLRSDVGVSILERKVRIRGVERLEGRIEFESTVHPIFLALNLTQVEMCIRDRL